MRLKKSGAFLSMDAIMYMVVILIVLVGGIGLIGQRQYAKYRDGIYRTQVDSIDASLIKYGKYHRGIKPGTVKYNSDTNTVTAETPAAYPATLKVLRDDRDYNTGWFDANILLDGDSEEYKNKIETKSGKHPGLIHYQAFDENGTLVTDDSDVAYAFNLYVELSEGDDYYSHNSLKTRSGGGAERKDKVFLGD